MPEHEDPKRKKLNLDGELGLSRRDLLRRGAIVGGTLLWVAPAIQSIAPPAFGQEAGPGTPQHFCCFCSQPSRRGLNPFQCLFNGFPPTDQQCAEFCSNLGYSAHQHCGPSSTATSCNQNGCVCP
jgi:hypothetical protein